MTDNDLPTITDIKAAHARIEPYILKTPILRSDVLDEIAGGRVLLKAECLQGTGSFKLRGALNHILSLTEEEKPRGVVAYSSGNHAQGVARAAKLAGVPAAIVMPADAPASKRERTARDGAEVILYDRETESREEIGGRIAKERGAKLVPPHDHRLTVAGQGTAGLEIVSQVEGPIDQLLACCGGGGMSAGIGLAVRDQHPNATVVVVEPEGFDDARRTLASGQRVRNARLSGSLCDALLAPQIGKIPFALLGAMDTEGVAVSDDEALAAVAFAARELKVVLEPGGAVALAAVLQGRVETAGRTTVAILSGGNIDDDVLSRALTAS